MSNLGEAPVGQVVYVPLDVRMAAYDYLPSQLRRLIDASPIEYAPTDALELWCKVDFDTDRAVKIYRETIRRQHPGWAPV